MICFSVRSGQSSNTGTDKKKMQLITSVQGLQSFWLVLELNFKLFSRIHFTNKSFELFNDFFENISMKKVLAREDPTHLGAADNVLHLAVLQILNNFQPVFQPCNKNLRSNIPYRNCITGK